MKKKSLTVKKNNSVKLAQRGISKKKTKNNPVKMGLFLFLQSKIKSKINLNQNAIRVNQLKLS